MASEYGVVEFLSTSNEPNIGIPELEGLSCCCGTIFVPRFTENFVYHFTFGLRCSERYTTLGKIVISIRRKSSLPRQEYFASRVSSTLNLSPCLRLYPSSVPRSTSSFFSSLLSSPLTSSFCFSPLFSLLFLLPLPCVSVLLLPLLRSLAATALCATIRLLWRKYARDSFRF